MAAKKDDCGMESVSRGESRSLTEDDPVLSASAKGCPKDRKVFLIFLPGASKRRPLSSTRVSRWSVNKHTLNSCFVALSAVLVSIDDKRSAHGQQTNVLAEEAEDSSMS